MNFRYLSFIIAFLSVFHPTFSQQEIKQEDIDRIVKKLSSDEMQGRKIFTPGIEKAADFIKEEFKNIGLVYLDGLTGYEQKFSLYSSTVIQSSFKINNQPVASNRFFAITNRDEVNWNSRNDMEIFEIKSGDDFQLKFFKYMAEGTGDALVFVHSQHRDTFNKYFMHFSAPSITHHAGGNKAFVFLLMDKPTEVSSLNFHIEYNRREQELKNLVGIIPGTTKTDEMVLFSAHYDHIGILPPVQGDSIANGADDNASGATAMINLARYFKNGPEPARTLVFVAFTAEESGGYGSKHFAQQVDTDKVIAMINIEMVGTPSKFGPNTAFLTGFEKSSLGKIMQENLKGQEYGIYPDPYPQQNLFYRSDNAIFAEFGVPAHTVSSSQIDKDPYYHTVKDEYKNLHIEHLTNMARAIALSVKGIVAGHQTPTRMNNDQ